jgi:lysophospholipase L1-like esterase
MKKEENEDSCSCNNPLVPNARNENPKWERVHQMNVAAMEQKGMANLDVVFLGDSITEGWLGQFYHNPDSRVQGAFTIFQSFFSKRTGGKYEGLPQGIAGDTIPELLWRIQHGEVPPYNEWQDRLTTTPFPVFWILIGTNDLGKQANERMFVLDWTLNVLSSVMNIQVPM